jgi:hypothetical protein
MRFENISDIPNVYTDIGVSHVSKLAGCVGDPGTLSVWDL